MTKRNIPWSKKVAHIDPYILGPTVLLIGLGTIMIYSASSLLGIEKFGDSFFFLKKQIFNLFLGCVGMAAIFSLKVRGLRKLAFPGLLVSGGLLVVTLFSSAGIEANHATRWLSLGGFRFQPSEFAKPLIILYVAAYLAKRGESIRDFRHGLLPLLLQVGVFLLLILKQPDFGTTVVLSLVVGIMLFAGHAKLSHLGALTGLGMSAGIALIQFSTYRRERLLSFLNPWADEQGKGFQIIQSFIAFQHGGVTGQGLGDGSQKLLYLPEAHTDFIYSVVAEELGLFGTVGIIVLFTVLVVQGLKLAIRIRDPFASNLALGLTSLIGIQAFFNMAVVMGLVPTKGLTLPLISYGGTSLIATMTCLGVLMSLSSSVALSGQPTRRRKRGSS